MYLRAIFQVQAPGGLYLEGRFNGGFFALLIHGGAYFRNFTVFTHKSAGQLTRFSEKEEIRLFLKHTDFRKTAGLTKYKVN